MSLTALNIRTDRGEYSRFESDRATILVRVLPTPAADLVDETVTVSLRRKNGLLMQQVAVTLSGAYPKGETVAFDLREILDADGIPICLRGDYYVEAVQGELSASAPLRVSIITVDAMKRDYCLGLPLYASEVLAPVKQPTLVTGVTITRVSDRTRSGLKGLTYKATGNTLSWSGGPAVAIGGDSEILPDATGGYIEVSIDSFNLPAADAAESIVIDKQVMSDDAIRAEIDRSVDEIQNTDLKVFLEPFRVATEPYFSAPEAGGWYDRKVEPLNYTRGDFNMHGLAWHLNLPLHQLLKVDKVSGFIGTNQSLRIDGGALTVNRKSGMLDILPFNTQYAYLYTFLMQISYWGVRDYIAGFWRYSAKAGIEVLEGDLLKLVGYTAAVPILTKAGLAIRGGLASESNSKDGVSRSVSFNSAGAYAAATTEYNGWKDKNTRRLANKYRGIVMVVL